MLAPNVLDGIGEGTESSEIYCWLRIRCKEYAMLHQNKGRIMKCMVLRPMWSSVLLSVLLVTSILVLLGAGPTSAAAEDGQPPPSVTSGEKPLEETSERGLKQAELDGIWRVLVVFFLLSAVIESALTPLFNWRLFLAWSLNKGVRTPITVLFAVIIVRGYGLDIFRDILQAVGESVGPCIGGQVLTALLLAGGSSGVNKLLQTWKVRLSDSEREVKATAAKGNKT